MSMDRLQGRKEQGQASGQKTAGTGFRTEGRLTGCRSERSRDRLQGRKEQGQASGQKED